MIPVRLELTNFLSYRDTAVLEFNDIHLACIAGPNGAGKSSIMDAMTWALFGKSRSSSDDDLVNRQAGADEAAEVRFTFILEDSNYRVIRSKRPNKTTILELQMQSADGGWQPLSESKVRETQGAIEDLLRMNYDTFTNASFLLQGKADEFTTRTAAQRKEILAELLGVTQWDQYREQATAARKEAEGDMALLDIRLNEIAAELEQEQARRGALEAAREAQQAISEKLAVKEQLLSQTRLNEAARAQQQQTVANLQGQLQRLRAKLQQTRETLDGRLSQREQLAATVEQAPEIKAAYESYQNADKALQAQQELANKFNLLQQAAQPFKLQLTEARSRLEQRRQGLEEQAARVEAGRVEQTTRADELRQSEEALTQARQRSDQLAIVEEELQQARQHLQQLAGQRKLLHQELTALQEQARKLEHLSTESASFRQSKAEAEEILDAASKKLDGISEQRQVLTQRQAEMQAIMAQQPGLHTEIMQLKERIDELAEADRDGTCPLCAQPLSEEHRQTVLETLRAEGKDKADTYRANKDRQKVLDLEIKDLEQTVHQRQHLERQMQDQQKRLAQSEARLEELAKQRSDWASQGETRMVELAATLADESEMKVAQQRVADLETAVQARVELNSEIQALQGRAAQEKARLTQIERMVADWEATGQQQLRETIEQLSSELFAVDARRELTRLQAQLDGLGYDPQQHARAVDRRDEFATAPERHQALQQALAALEPLDRALEDLEIQINDQQHDLGEQNMQLEQAREQLAALEVGRIDLPALEAEVLALRERRIAADHDVGAAQQRLNVLDEQRRQRESFREQKTAVAERVRRLKLLETACGRKGVQALLIEHALPEIEDGANDLLERLTGGEMRVKFDTQRQLKSKKDTLAETLDIVISDRAGERPYDNYSGGEQFRINFAIRLALSQMLAHRAGARLQTLVIDEGFGSQDPEGRQRLIEAINAVQDQFACILVITHIDELREAFPTRIEVQKTPNGSQINVF